METSPIPHRSFISAPISSSFRLAIGRYASYSRYSTLAQELSSIRVVPTKVATAPQSGRKASTMSVLTSMGFSTMLNNLTSRDRRQHSHLVPWRDCVIHPGVLTVYGEG